MATPIQSFTVTQVRIGEPLLFHPALGSKELEALVDAYVPGSTSKQDKLAGVTLEFFNLAQVDIYTGFLTRHYTVDLSPHWIAPSFEQSPAESQSSGSSPPFYTPSPASSMTFADSGYGSISMTPPTRTRGASSGRVTKKKTTKKTTKKDTKKTTEVRLPGFSIMTKDGVDVTSSAGRGTKTKEQREHAHLMRIMKACDECKRKKVRCDPSHRGLQPDKSRSSTSTTSASCPNPSPSRSIPSIRRSTTQASPEMPSFGNIAIDDFVLFPEDGASLWDTADMSFPEYEEDLDLSQFDFDFSSLNEPLQMPNTSNYFDWSHLDQQVTGFQRECPFGHDPLTAGEYAGPLSVSSSHPAQAPAPKYLAFDHLATNHLATDHLAADYPPSPGATAGGSLEYWGAENPRSIVAKTTEVLKSALMSGLRHLATATSSLISPPSTSKNPSRSLGGLLSSSKSLLSTPAPLTKSSYEDPSFLAMFNGLRLGHRLAVA